MVTTIKSITGYDDYLYHHMKESFKKAKKIDIIVSFLMESGVKLLEQDLIELKTKNIPIRILTGNYLNITQPSALYRLKDISVIVLIYDFLMSLIGVFMQNLIFSNMKMEPTCILDHLTYQNQLLQVG